MISGYRANLIVPPDRRARKLSKKYIEKNLNALHRDLHALRVEADAHFLELRDRATQGDLELNAEQHWKLSNYPVSCCLEITRHVLSKISQAVPSSNSKGLRALQKFSREGGQIKRVWGELRQSYFQNAIQAGSYYIDVANDTVDPTKDKVDILPIQDSGFRNIDSYHAFAAVAESYWKCRMVPNIFFPNLAPFLPIITEFENGVLGFDSTNTFMMPMNLEKNFQLAHEFIFDNSRRNENFETCRDGLVELMSIRSNPDKTHLLHFTPVRDDAKLENSFEACKTASPTAMTQTINQALRIKRYIKDAVSALEI